MGAVTVEPFDACAVVMACGRKRYHRGHHGGFRRLSEARPGALSPKELGIVRSFAKGDTWDQIAADHHVSKSTLARHLANAREKYGAGTLVELLTALGWLTVP